MRPPSPLLSRENEEFLSCEMHYLCTWTEDVFIYLFILLELRVGSVRECFQVIHAELGFSERCRNYNTILIREESVTIPSVVYRM